MDIGPLCEDAAAQYGIPLVGLLAMLMAESGLDRTATREGIWPDCSYGMAQMTVATAQGYGIGDGSDSDYNKLVVRQELYKAEASIDVGAHHLSGCYGQAAAAGYYLDHLMALRAYNGGSYGLTEGYTEKYAANIANYEAALAWARGIVDV